MRLFEGSVRPAEASQNRPSRTLPALRLAPAPVEAADSSRLLRRAPCSSCTAAHCRQSSCCREATASAPPVTTSRSAPHLKMPPKLELYSARPFMASSGRPSGLCSSEGMTMRAARGSSSFEVQSGPMARRCGAQRRGARSADGSFSARGNVRASGAAAILGPSSRWRGAQHALASAAR